MYFKIRCDISDICEVLELDRKTVSDIILTELSQNERTKLITEIENEKYE